jgi:hypothetical protein
MNATHYLSSPLSLSALLRPLLWGAALLFFLFAGRSMWQSFLAPKWSDREWIECGVPGLGLLRKWRRKLARLRFRLPQTAKQGTPEFVSNPTPPVAPAAPLKKLPQPTLPIFGATSGESKERFVWEEHHGIE